MIYLGNMEINDELFQKYSISYGQRSRKNNSVIPYCGNTELNDNMFLNSVMLCHGHLVFSDNGDTDLMEKVKFSIKKKTVQGLIAFVPNYAISSCSLKFAGLSFLLSTVLPTKYNSSSPVHFQRKCGFQF